MFRGGTTNEKSLGRLGEDLAVEYFKGLGYKILDRNIREKFGEIDILAKDGSQTIHFAEVKTISAGYADWSGMEPEDNLSRSKLQKMKKMADWYMGSHPEFAGDYQLDLVAIKIEEETGKKLVRFYPNIA